MKKIIFLLIIFSNVPSLTKEGAPTNEEIVQIREGNLALPSSQQPGTLFGFGQNVVDKHDIQAFAYPFSQFGKHENFTDVIPLALYGIRNDLSILLEFPIAAHLSSDGHKSADFADFVIQLEYAPYIKETATKTDEISIVGSIIVPTGNDRKTPSTGYGSPSFFLGLTANHESAKWYCFMSYGAFLTTSHHNNTKAGNHFLYQGGFGRNIAYSSNRWILTAMLEFNGVYTQKSKSLGIIDNNSGGNIFMVGPSLWFSTQRFLLQIGVMPVVSQHHFGSQLKSSFLFGGGMGWKFN